MRSLSTRLRARLKLPLAIVVAEEVARELADAFAARLPRPTRAATKVFKRRDVEVAHALEVLNVRRPGRLRELLVVSPTPKFGVTLLADGFARLDAGYEELAEVGRLLEGVAAFQDVEGRYVLHVKNVGWLREALCAVTVAERIKLHNVFAMWDEFIEAAGEV